MPVPGFPFVSQESIMRNGLAKWVLLLLGPLLLGATPARAQTTVSDAAIRNDIETLKGDVAEMRKTLEEMRQLLQQRLPAARAQSAAGAAPSVARLTGIGKEPMLGKSDAPVTVVEFSDYQCPFCKRYVTTTLPELKKDYIDAGKVRYVFRDFPLDTIHPQARKAAEAAHCAGDQGKYWEMHDTLFANQQALRIESLKNHARKLALREDEFEKCLDQGKYAKRVDDGLGSGSAIGLSGTPSFVIGVTRPDGTLEGTRLIGSQPAAAFRKAIDQLLEAKSGS